MDHRPKHKTASWDHKDLSRREVLYLSGPAALSILSGMTLSVGRAYPADSTKKIRIGVVGGGFGLSFYWHEHPNCVVTGITDLQPERRERLRQVYRRDAA